MCIPRNRLCIGSITSTLMGSKYGNIVSSYRVTTTKFRLHCCSSSHEHCWISLIVCQCDVTLLGGHFEWSNPEKFIVPILPGKGLSTVAEGYNGFHARFSKFTGKIFYCDCNVPLSTAIQLFVISAPQRNRYFQRSTAVPTFNRDSVFQRSAAIPSAFCISTSSCSCDRSILLMVNKNY